MQKASAFTVSIQASKMHSFVRVTKFNCTIRGLLDSVKILLWLVRAHTSLLLLGEFQLPITDKWYKRECLCNQNRTHYEQHFYSCSHTVFLNICTHSRASNFQVANMIQKSHHFFSHIQRYFCLLCTHSYLWEKS